MESPLVVHCCLFVLLLSLQCTTTVPARSPVVATRDQLQSALHESEPEGTNTAPLFRDCLFACARQRIQVGVEQKDAYDTTLHAVQNSLEGAGVKLVQKP